VLVGDLAYTVAMNQKDNHFILSPFYIDKAADNLYSFQKDDWEINSPEISTEADAQGKAIAVHKPLADKVEAALNAGKRPISVAGDCCATIPVMAGLHRAGTTPTFLWLDSHGDFNTWETTPSGFLGGMPLAMIAGLGELRMADAVGLKPHPESKIILADGRDLDPGEQILVDNSDIVHIKDMNALKDYKFEGPVYVHFDVDVLHLDDIPAVNYPAKDGPRASEVADVFRHLVASLDIVAISATMGVWNEDLDGVEQSQKVATELFDILIG